MCGIDSDDDIDSDVDRAKPSHARIFGGDGLEMYFL